MLRVTDKRQISLNMLRITLQGAPLADFNWRPGCYVKLRIPTDEGLKTRTYTARSHDSDRQAVDIDFALHHPPGPATQWALEANLGDEIELRGPGQLKTDPAQGDWYLFGADMSALPAAISIIESLPAQAKGYAFFEVMDEQDKQALTIPSGIEMRWFIHPNPKEKSNQQLNAIQGITFPEGVPNVFVAGELSTIREIKRHLREEERFKHAHTYISSYWKIGSTEEEHKQAKRLL